ncbi:MAG: DUF2235 domain-containing protein [Leptolyngbyaceae cyanobacterium bins.349]|nr:DUF2235 domain-containing protein [Leptolyngbyaceae cyanobacterium bins.349]
MKRLVVCCDGTWNQLSRFPTNVVKLSQAVKPFDDKGIAQVVYYQRGLGTKWYDRIPGGAFGWGIDYNIKSAYEFLCFNYESGDEIYLFGFSRGAYTARSLAGMIYCSGLLARQYIGKVEEAYNLYRNRDIRPGSDTAKQFRADYGVRDAGEDQISITLLGCWDTVGSLGVPNLIPGISQLLNRKYQFHDTELNRKIQTALHAVAIDERRKVFDVTPMRKSLKNAKQLICQLWFPGGHGCVGGGTPEHCKLSDNALMWMVNTIAHLKLGLALDLNRLQACWEVDPTINFDNSPGILGLIGLHDRPILDGFEALDDSVKKRWRNRPDYRPANLRPFAGQLNNL